jgi:hypothetical protein
MNFQQNRAAQSVWRTTLLQRCKVANSDSIHGFISLQKQNGLWVFLMIKKGFVLCCVLLQSKFKKCVQEFWFQKIKLSDTDKLQLPTQTSSIFSYELYFFSRTVNTGRHSKPHAILPKAMYTTRVFEKLVRLGKNRVKCSTISEYFFLYSLFYPKKGDPFFLNGFIFTAEFRASVISSWPRSQNFSKKKGGCRRFGLRITD